MNHRAVFLSLLFLIACDKQPSISDPVSTVKGVVVDSQTHSMLDSVLVGYKNPAIPDSAIFQGDSLMSGSDNAFTAVQTSRNGYFQFDFFLSPTPPPFDLMFAFMTGYHLWRFKVDRDTVHALGGNTDSLSVKLIKK